MSSRRWLISMPPVNFGLHFDRIGVLPRLKLGPRVTRKILLEAYWWTGEEALQDGMVDLVANPEEMKAKATEVGHEHADSARMGVYGLLRGDLRGEIVDKFRRIGFVHSRRTVTPAKVKI